MKKLKLSLVIALLGMASLVGAQSASLNVKGGLNMSNFYGDNLSDRNMKPGFHLGVGADLEFVPNISLQTGLFFSTKGAEYTTEIPVGVGVVEYSVTASYIQLPIHLAYKIDVNPGTKVFFHAGPYIAYGVGGKRTIKSKYSADLQNFFGKQEVNTFDKDFGYKPFDYGVGLGVGAEFGVILLDLGWDLGLKNIARNIEAISVYKPNIKNQSAYLSIGYKF
jgi:hypothetical protein